MREKRLVRGLCEGFILFFYFIIIVLLFFLVVIVMLKRMDMRVNLMMVRIWVSWELGWMKMEWNMKMRKS